MSDEQKNQILAYRNDCQKAYKKYAKLKDKSMMDLNLGAIQAVDKVLSILEENA